MDSLKQSTAVDRRLLFKNGPAKATALPGGKHKQSREE